MDGILSIHPQLHNLSSSLYYKQRVRRGTKHIMLCKDGNLRSQRWVMGALFNVIPPPREKYTGFCSDIVYTLAHRPSPIPPNSVILKATSVWLFCKQRRLANYPSHPNEEMLSTVVSFVDQALADEGSDQGE